MFEGEGVGMILGVELIREEEEAEGMGMMGIDNTAAIHTTHAIKPSPSHHIWDMFHRRVVMLYNKHKGVLDLGDMTLVLTCHMYKFSSLPSNITCCHTPTSIVAN